MPLAPRLTRTEDAHARETILTLDLGARHQPFRAVQLDVSDPAFFRGVTVEARVDPAPGEAGSRARALAWHYLGECAVYRYAEDGATRESLRLDVSGRERVLRLRIRNRDDRPLAIRGATVLVPVERLAFEARPGASYRLRYGDPRVAPPSYDLARTAGDPALFAARAIGGGSARPGGGARSRPPPLRPGPSATRPWSGWGCSPSSPRSAPSPGAPSARPVDAAVIGRGRCYDRGVRTVAPLVVLAARRPLRAARWARARPSSR